MKLETPRLILRYATIRDSKNIAEQINNLNVSRYLLVVPFPYKKKDAEDYIKHCEEKRKQKPQTGYSFSIELKSEKKIIGGISLEDIDYYQGTADIGYWLGENYWRKGYGTESCKAILDFGFYNLKLRKIRIPAFAKNAASNTLAKKLGGVLEGTLRQHCRAKSTGKLHDENIYGIMKKEWEETRKKI
jgi:ribosomal-protein-alanine N-acetyltransferase